LTMGELDLEVETITSLAAKMAAGNITARSLTQHCLDRIKKFDDLYNAVIELNPDALDIADDLDRLRSAGNLRGPLHGMPILIKDNIDTGDKMMTTAGSLALVGSPADQDAFVVRQLRQAGAVILGKTNLSEWANFRSGQSSSGWSSRGGQTRNAYDPIRSPGGSSSGSAVAVALGFCVAAIGTETDGSIISPAAMNSIVGFKPTVGLVSRSGIIPISHTQDTAGPMARSVADAAVLAACICGPDADDAATKNASRGCDGLQTTDLSSGALKGVRIGVARNYCGFHDDVDALFAQSIEDLKSYGAEIVDDLELTPAAAIRPSEILVMATEFKAGLNAYLASRNHPNRIATLQDIIAYNHKHANDVMPWFRQDILEMSQATDGLASKAYVEALATCRSLSRESGIDALIQTHRLDAIIAPTTSTPWLIDWVNGDNRSGGSACPAAVSGYPNISVPAGYVHGLPVGLSFFSSAWKDVKLLSIASAYEQKSRNRKPPVL
jgi:amidase